MHHQVAMARSDQKVIPPMMIGKVPQHRETSMFICRIGLPTTGKGKSWYASS